MATLEKNLERWFRAEIKARGGVAFKQTCIVGIPDRLVILPGGRHVWVELKTDKGRTSKIQKAVHRKLLKLGCEVEVLYGKDQMREWLDQI